VDKIKMLKENAIKIITTAADENILSFNFAFICFILSFMALNTISIYERYTKKQIDLNKKYYRVILILISGYFVFYEKINNNILDPLRKLNADCKLNNFAEKLLQDELLKVNSLKPIELFADLNSHWMNIVFPVGHAFILIEIF
jgi:hypothetical protein